MAWLSEIGSYNFVVATLHANNKQEKLKSGTRAVSAQYRQLINMRNNKLIHGYCRIESNDTMHIDGIISMILDYHNFYPDNIAKQPYSPKAETESRDFTEIMLDLFKRILSNKE